MGFSLVGGTFYLKDADYRFSAARDEIQPNVEPADLEYSVRAYKLLLGGAVSTLFAAPRMLFVKFSGELHFYFFEMCRVEVVTQAAVLFLEHS